MNRLALLLPLLAACGQPTHLQYDYGRSYNAAFNAQADLTRPSVANAAYPLSGQEAEAIRTAAEKSTSEEKSGEAEVIDK